MTNYIVLFPPTNRKATGRRPVGDYLSLLVIDPSGLWLFACCGKLTNASDRYFDLGSLLTDRSQCSSEAIISIS